MKVKIIAKKIGTEIATPASPYMPYTPEAWAEVENKTRLYMAAPDDDWWRVEANEYELRDVEIPDWLPVESYIKNFTAWDFILADGFPCAAFPGCEKLAGYLLKNLDIAKVIIEATFKPHPRSKFLQSLSEQVYRWAQADSPYSAPLSRSQVAELLRYARYQ